MTQSTPQPDKTLMVSAQSALPGRVETMTISNQHFVSQHPIQPPFPAYLECAYFGMGCFWGAERLFWQQEGVFSTAVGYQAGFTPNPTYEEVCSGQTGHAETVLVIFDPSIISYESLLQLFWEHHDPAQGMQQGGDIGTQYRSMVLTTSDTQMTAATASLQRYQSAMAQQDTRRITTTIAPASAFYYAEEYHQQYLAKNPEGYCGLGGIGVCLPPA